MDSQPSLLCWVHWWPSYEGTESTVQHSTAHSVHWTAIRLLQPSDQPTESIDYVCFSLSSKSQRTPLTTHSQFITYKRILNLDDGFRYKACKLSAFPCTNNVSAEDCRITFLLSMLGHISTKELLRELTRRNRCDAKKSQQRTIFVGPPGSGKGIFAA